METEIESDRSNVDGPASSESTGDAVVGTEPMEGMASMATTAEEVTAEDDDGEIVDDSDDNSSVGGPTAGDGGRGEELASQDAFDESPNPLARKMTALEKLKSMKFGAGKNPYSMPVTQVEERRRTTPPPPSMYDQKASKRKNANDWDRPTSPSGRPLHADMGRRAGDLQADRSYQYDRRSQSPPAFGRDRRRQREKHRRGDRFERRRPSATPSPPGLNIEQKILSLAGSAGADDGASRTESVLTYTTDEITRLTAADLKRLVFSLQSIEREHSRLLSLRATQLNELRDLYLKETNELSVLKTQEEMENRQKNGGVLPPLFGMSHGGGNNGPPPPPFLSGGGGGMPPPSSGPSQPPPFFNPRSSAPPPPFVPPPFTSVPSSIQHMPPPPVQHQQHQQHQQHPPGGPIYCSMPPPTLTTATSTSTAGQPQPPFMFSGSPARPPGPPPPGPPPLRGPLPPPQQPSTSMMSSSRGASNGLSFPSAPSMLAPPRFDYDYEQQRRHHQQQQQQQPPQQRFHAPQQQTNASHHSPARPTGSGAPGGGGNAGPPPPPRWQPQQQQHQQQHQRNMNNGAARMPPFKRGRFEITRKDRRSPTSREISEIVAIIPDEHDHERDKGSDIVVVIPDDDDEFDSLEAESRKESDSHQ